jgi:hypothetical protein
MLCGMTCLAQEPATNRPVQNPFNPVVDKTVRADQFAFAEKPAVKRQEGGAEKGWVITFATRAACDATVAIVGPDDRVVCHLASGVLGTNAPYPFRQGTLAQALAWDGRNDQGKPAPAGCKVRVSLGLGATFGFVTPLLGGGGRYGGDLGQPSKPERSLTEDEYKAWPKMKMPDGAECLVPIEMKGVTPLKDGKCLWDNPFHDEMTVDPIREEVYVALGHTCFNGMWMRFDGKTGKWDPSFKMSAMEVSIHPTNGLMYVRDMKAKSPGFPDWGCHFLSRRDHAGKIVKFTGPAADKDGEVFMPGDRSAKNFGDGMAFSPNGDLYVLADIRRNQGVKYDGRPGPSVIIYDEEGNQKPYRKTIFAGANQEPRKSEDKDGKEALDFGRIAEIPSGGSSGIGADRFGNFWVGSTARTFKSFPKELNLYPDDMPVNQELQTNRMGGFLRMYTGSVLKFGPAGGTASDTGPATHFYWANPSRVHKVNIEGVLWTFQGLTPTTTMGLACICQQARICVDAWGRVLVPQCHRQSILVLDANANTILRIGKYGNADTKGPEICFTMPRYVAASDSAVYVTDRALGRVLKANLAYGAEETVPLP